MREESMTGMKQKEFGERLTAAKDAKQAMVAKFLKRPDPDDPSVVERREARAAVSAAREARLAERKAARLAEEARIAAEREAEEVRAAAEREALQAAEREREAAAAIAKRDEEERLETERKAARDARYAARKARK
jgi:hypothetical protein